MRKHILYQLLILLCILTPFRSYAEEEQQPERKRNFIQKIIEYFNNSNKEHSDKPFDFSLIGGPHYSSETQFGIGIVAAAAYRTDRADTTLQTSNSSLYFDISTAGFYMVGIRGNHIAPKSRYKIDYDVNLLSFKTKFWGIGYESCNNDDNESSYREFQIALSGAFMMRLSNNLYAGPTLNFYRTEAHNPENQSLWNGQDLYTTNFGFGAAISFDNRDCITNASRGWLLKLEQNFYLKKLGNSNAFSSTEITAAGYAPLWKGGTLASQLHSYISYGNTPWGLMATLGGPAIMRGYYEGRYRDKSEIDLTVELRQHVWRRSGIAVWGGAATIFPKFSDIRFKKILPNWGVGYRWELKKNMNVRLDVGFGKQGQWGFVFNINEAF